MSDKKKAKGADKKKAKAAPSAEEGVRIANHPRARAEVSKWRAIGGLAGMCLTAYAAHKGGLPPFDVGLRALIGGIVGSLIGRTVAVIVWRNLLVAEVRAAHARLTASPPPATDVTQRIQA